MLATNFKDLSLESVKPMVSGQAQQLVVLVRNYKLSQQFIHDYTRIIHVLYIIYTRFCKNKFAVRTWELMLSFYPFRLEFVNNDRSFRRILGVKPDKKDGLVRRVSLRTKSAVPERLSRKAFLL